MTNQLRFATIAVLLVAPSLGHAEQLKIVEWSFAAGADGYSPRGTLLPAADGSFYGTTSVGGAGADGTVFQLAPREHNVSAS